MGPSASNNFGEINTCLNTDDRGMKIISYFLDFKVSRKRVGRKCLFCFYWEALKNMQSICSISVKVIKT